MSNKEEIKTFLDSLYKSENIYFQIYAINNAKSDVFFKMLNPFFNRRLYHRSPEFTKAIIQRLYLEKEIKSKALEENYQNLCCSSSVEIREFAAKNANISIILNMTNEKEEKVISAILNRLETEKEELTNEDYFEFATHTSSKEMQIFIANNASIDILLSIAKSINSSEIFWSSEPIKILLNRLKAEVTEKKE